MKESKNKIILSLIIGIIIGGLIFSGVTYYLVSNELKSSDKDNTENKEDNNEDNDKTKDFDIAKAEELLEYFGFNVEVGSGQNIYDFLYNDQFKMIQAIRNVEQSKVKNMKCSAIYTDNKLDSYGRYQLDYGVCPKEKETNVISYNDVNEVYKKMYGIDVEKKGLAFLSSSYIKFYDFDKKTNSFVETECGSCGGAYSTNFLIKQIKSAKITENSLKIEVYYLSDEFQNGITVDYSGKMYHLNTLKINKQFKVNDEESFKKEILENYLDKLDVYEVYFEQQGNNYIFKSLNKKIG